MFFAWGFVCANNDPLLAAAREIFRLSYTEALLTQITFFLAFATISLPAAALLARAGAVRTMLLALGAMLAGCIVIQAIGWMPRFALMLAALFLVAAGVTTLQVAANPLAAALGPSERSHFRLTLAHSFNALGVVCGVHFGAAFLLAGPLDAAAIARAFLIIGAMLSGLMLLVLATGRTITRSVPPAEAPGGMLDALRSRWAVAGAVALGLYVGSEVSIGSVLILYLARPDTLALPLAEAGAMVANFYWGGALVGRFAGSYLLRFVPAPRLLGGVAAVAAGLCAAALLLPGPVAAWCLLAVGLFNAVMFPTIFALTLEQSGVSASATSGLLCLAIGGGAVLPLAVGRIGDLAGLGWIFVVPMLGYLYILGFALRCALSSASRRPARGTG